MDIKNAQITKKSEHLISLISATLECEQAIIELMNLYTL